MYSKWTLRMTYEDEIQQRKRRTEASGADLGGDEMGRNK